MEKTKVVIASILKPIDDTRMYEKFGLSLGQTNEYEINIIGFASKNLPVNGSINFHPLGPFQRMSFKRFWAPLSVWRKIVKLKPHILIANTHEILIVTFLYRILFGGKIIYDIRENYSKNLRKQKVYQPIVRSVLAVWIRFKEHLLSPFFHAHIVAERIYFQELPFLKKKAVLLENKYQGIDEVGMNPNGSKSQGHKLLYSGTIAKGYGVFEAIDIAKALHEINPQISLTIIGYCASKPDLLLLKEKIHDIDFIDLKGGDHLVPHHEILGEIKKADFGLILNQPNIASDRKLPTRLFEYTANHLPILCINNPYWIEFLDQFNAGLSIDPSQFNSSVLLQNMQQQTFYTHGDTSISNWKSEEPKFLQLIASLDS